MSTWMRCAADFGDPILRLTCDCRSEVGREFREAIGKVCTVTMNTGQFQPELCEIVTKFIERQRPDLKGLILLRLSMPRHELQWEFLVAHPSFERQPIGSVPPSQRLETCWTCGKPLPSEGQRWMRTIQLSDAAEEGFWHSREVCSEACVTAAPLRVGKKLVHEHYTPSLEPDTAEPTYGITEHAGRHEVRTITDDVTYPPESIKVMRIVNKIPVPIANGLTVKEIQWEDHPRSGISKKLLDKVLTAEHEERLRVEAANGIGKDAYNAEVLLSQQQMTDPGEAIICGPFLSPGRTDAPRCSVCHFPLAQDSGAVGDKCSLHKE